MTKDKYKHLEDLIVGAKVGESLAHASEYLANTSYLQEIALLKSRYEKNEKEKRMNTIESENYNIEYNRITVALLSIMNKSHSSLKGAISTEDFAPEITFDSEFNHFQSLENFATILNEFEYNFRNNISPCCKISFPLENVLLYELKKGAKRSELAAIKNVISKIEGFKKIVADLIVLIITKHIHYNLTDNKIQQAVVLKSVLFGLKQSGIFEDMYMHVSKSGINLTELTIWDSLKENKVPTSGNEIFLNGRVPRGHTKIDVYNNNSNPRITHSIWLSPSEMEGFEKNLKRNGNFGKGRDAKDILMMLPGGDSFSATGYLPQSVIFEKLIPKAVSNSYFQYQQKTSNEELVNKFINIDNLYVGLG